MSLRRIVAKFMYRLFDGLCAEDHAAVTVARLAT